jgi:peptidoglycan/xylan/chitin deacetylase (PgdA/CDA1 family)
MCPAFIVCLIVKFIGLACWWRAPWAGTALFFGPDLYLLYHLLVPSARGLCPVATYFSTERREVWLTIDDGPDEVDTPRILRLLEQHRAHATFFVVGRRAASHPELVAEIVRRGQGVGHHTHTHPVFSFWRALPPRLGRELDDGLAVLRAAGIRPQWFRPPVGIKNFFLARALETRGLACVAWSVRSGDCVNRDPDRIVAHVLKRLKPGAIILMHEGQGVPGPVRVEAIARLLAALDARGIACVLPDPGQLR